MEAQLQVEEVQPIVHQHANGEVFTANGLEAARGMCPVLGKLSLEEVGLLMELEALGKEPVLEEPILPVEVLETPVAMPIPKSVEQLLQQAPTLLEVTELSEAPQEPPQEPLAEPRIVIERAIPEVFREPTEVIVRHQEQEPPKAVEAPMAIADEPKPPVKPVLIAIPFNAPVAEEVPTEQTPSEPPAVSNATEVVEVGTPKATPLPEAPELHMAEVTIEPEVHVAIPVMAPELAVPLEDVAEVITELIEVIENEETNNQEAVQTIVEQIINLPAELELLTNEDTQLMDEKLEALFVELLEEAGIDYSPELVVSLITLTKAHYFDQLLTAVPVIEVVKGQEPTNDIGTREFLQKLQRSLNATKRTVANFYAIGKSLLRLYAPELLFL